MEKRVLAHIYNSLYKFFISSIYLRKANEKKGHDGIIKVAFLVQMPEVWDKQAPVYEAMLNDDRFDPQIIVFPSFNRVRNDFDEYGQELAYFVSLYPNEKIVKAYDRGSWIDLKELQFDYVFLQRCWENYLPKRYKTKKLIKYTKTCYIPYASAGLKDGKEYFKSSFFNNLYICFCGSEERVSFHAPGKYRKVVFLGSPAVETLINKNRCSDLHNSEMNVLWTPRWSENPKYGGTSFYKFMYHISKLKEYKGINVIFRPHPLMFQEFVKQGRFSEQQIKEYVDSLQNNGVVIDKNVLVEDTLIDASVLITDYSSIILNYFIMGRPVIYCADTTIDFEKIYSKMVDCFYIADNWDDVADCVLNIQMGIDPLKSKRDQLISEIIRDNENATEKIIEYIYMDHVGDSHIP